MKKRIVCVLLTLIMLLSLVPMGASAASHTTSESAITILKRIVKYEEKCKHYSGEEFRIGYGTVCTEKHSFGTNGLPNANPAVYTDKDGKTAYKEAHETTQIKADEALRAALKTFDSKVCAFETSSGLALNQHQHDALVLLSYLGGSDWMTGNGVLKSALTRKAGTNELLNAINTWNKNIDLTRGQIIVNMYLNGVYSIDVPTNYGVVYYDANGGAMPQHDTDSNSRYTYYYDLNASVEHPVTPTNTNKIFMGWYANVEGTDTSKAVWASSLNHIYNNHNLKALWVDAKNPAPVVVNYKLLKSQLVDQVAYNVSDGKENTDATKKLREELDKNGYIAVDKDIIDTNGIRWSHPAGYGEVRIKVGTPSGNSFTDKGGKVIATATVTVNGYLNLRQEAGTDSKIIGALAKNDNVNIYEIKVVNGHQWGRSASGWLCLTYARVIMKNDVTVSDEGISVYAFTGTIKNSSVVPHVEAGETTNTAQYYDAKGDLQYLSIPGDASVTLTNLTLSGGKTWAKATWKNPEWEYTNSEKKETKTVYNVRSGWIKLDDVNMDPAKFVTAASVNVRSGWGDAANLIFTLNKGVEVQVLEIRLEGENIWGRIKVKLAADQGGTDEYGYVNLATKYFTRKDAPTVETEQKITGQIATVINTDSLKVRSYGASYAARIGALSRGTTVAVWEANEDGWYKVDSNKNGVYDYEDDGWCFGQYLSITKGSVNGNTTVTDSNGNKYETDGTGKGIIANTYSGVNVRTGPSTAYASTGKVLTGTIVDILETANAGKWGRIAQGWISMDYVTMVSYNEAAQPSNSTGTTVESFDKAEKTTTTAVYTGTLKSGATIYRNPVDPVAAQAAAEVIRTTDSLENITMYELAKVSTVVKSDDTTSEDKTTVTNTTITTTTYWARINEGWVKDPESWIELNALDEKVHTQTGTEKLNVRKGIDSQTANESGEVFDILVQGDQVKVTALDIINDKVWGRVETKEGTGWIRLDYMSEGEVYVKAPVAQPPVNNVLNNLGQTSSVGGFVNNTSGYRYTGKVIRANEVNVRATPSTAASKTTALKNGAALVIYETTIAENMAWGRCDAGWVYLYYVDLTPVVNGAVDARVVYNDNTIIYSDVNATTVAGSYARMSTVDIYEIVGKMARTEQGWINTDDLL